MQKKSFLTKRSTVLLNLFVKREMIGESERKGWGGLGFLHFRLGLMGWRDLGFVIFLPQSPECQDYSYVPLILACKLCLYKKKSTNKFRLI